MNTEPSLRSTPPDPTPLPQPPFLPMSREEMDDLGWRQLDVLLVTGDAYVDHPSFGAALLGRWLVAHGFRVGIVAQPSWTGSADLLRMGPPRLFVGIAAGALDSMLAHYTAFRQKRREDAYTPGGKPGARPNRACIAYANLARQAFPGAFVAIGGIEASMRRTTHYDFWSDALRRSILLDSKADLLLYGMAEIAVLGLARRLSHSGPPPRGAPWEIPGVAWLAASPPPTLDRPALALPSHEAIAADPRRLMDATLAVERQVHEGLWATQAVEGRTLVLAPPAPPLDTPTLDALYSLPFQRRSHPAYPEAVPALQPVQFSLTTHRGCAGGCTFCSLSFHQGRTIQSRGRGSLAQETERMVRHPDWRGSIPDVGGPSANMWAARCRVSARGCQRPSCLHPSICAHFATDQAGLLALLRALSRIPGVSHVRTASGIRHDLALLDPDYVRGLTREFVGGQLKLAPEHLAPAVLSGMRKPPFESFERFLNLFQTVSAECGKEQYIVPYLISAFPGCTDSDMRRLSAWLKSRRWAPQQVQCFIPLPGTVAAAMFYAGIAPDGTPIPVARTDAERLRQHRLLAASLDRTGERRPHPRSPRVPRRPRQERP